MAEADAGPDILSKLTGAPCRVLNCDGTLVPGRYKGDRAVTCSACRTPAVRVWGDG